MNLFAFLGIEVGDIGSLDYETLKNKLKELRAIRRREHPDITKGKIEKFLWADVLSEIIENEVLLRKYLTILELVKNGDTVVIQQIQAEITDSAQVISFLKRFNLNQQKSSKKKTKNGERQSDTKLRSIIDKIIKIFTEYSLDFPNEFSYLKGSYEESSENYREYADQKREFVLRLLTQLLIYKKFEYFSLTTAQKKMVKLLTKKTLGAKYLPLSDHAIEILLDELGFCDKN